MLTTVTDNGIGIPDGDTTAPGTRTAIDGGTGTAINNGDQPARRVGGLDNMRTRAELCGGTLAIERPTDGGTRITWRVPLHD
ncbi:ATP-binding protein [Streptomyces sp. NPDC005151]